MENPPEFILALTRLTGPFPFGAVRKASASPGESIPWLLRFLELSHAKNGVNVLIQERALLLPIVLLAQFREPRAYQPLVQLIRANRFQASRFDLVVEGLGRALASVSGGDSELIERLINDRALDPYARNAALEGLGAMYHCGMIDRSLLMRTLKQLMNDALIACESSFLWSGVVAMAADFCFSELWELLRQMFFQGLVNDGFESLHSLKHRIHAHQPDPDTMRAYRLISDAESEFSTWPCFLHGASVQNGGCHGAFRRVARS